MRVRVSTSGLVADFKSICVMPCVRTKKLQPSAPTRTLTLTLTLALALALPLTLPLTLTLTLT